MWKMRERERSVCVLLLLLLLWKCRIFFYFFSLLILVLFIIVDQKLFLLFSNKNHAAWLRLCYEQKWEVVQGLLRTHNTRSATHIILPVVFVGAPDDPARERESKVLPMTKTTYHRRVVLLFSRSAIISCPIASSSPRKLCHLFCCCIIYLYVYRIYETKMKHVVKGHIRSRRIRRKDSAMNR